MVCKDGLENIDYLWFSVRLCQDPDGAACPELALLHHGLTGAKVHTGTLSVKPAYYGDGWFACLSWQRNSDYEGIPVEFPHKHRFLFGKTSLQAIEKIYGFVHRFLMLQAHANGYSRVHAALLDVDGIRIMLAGSSGIGKTTLSLRLASEGAALQSDEGVFIKDGLSLGLPRRIHIKESGVHGLPANLSSRCVTLPYSPPVYALDPGILYPVGADPRFTEKPIDLVFLLEDRAGPLRITPAEPQEALWRLLSESSGYASSIEPLEASRSRLILELAQLISRTPALMLRGFGDRIDIHTIKKIWNTL